MLNPISISQFDPRWRRKLLHPNPLPNPIPVSINNYGCYVTCISSMLGLKPDQLVDQNQEMFDRGGNMASDPLLKKLGYSLKRTPCIEGQPWNNLPEPVIARTSFYASKARSGLSYAFPTHFFIILPSGEMIDPAAPPGQNGPKSLDKYRAYINEYRQLQPINNTPTPKCQVCGK